MDRALTGISASPGIVIGPVRLLRWEVPDVPHRIVSDEQIEDEIARLHDGFERARERLRQVAKRAEKHAGPEEAAIFDVQISILDDGHLQRQVEDYIRQNLAAEKAFDLVMLEWRQQFGRSTSAMTRERVGDLTDVQIRVLTILMDLPDHDPVAVEKGTGAILVTHDLTPSLTVQLDRDAIAGIATDEGTRISHVAILARSLGLPAVVGLREAVARLRGDEIVVLDGTSGMLVVNPSEAEIDAFRRRAVAEAETEAELQKLSPAEPITTNGVRITIRANVDLPDEAEHAAKSGAEGV
ncbi:MAG: phosphoenolpyruvate-utilizing N-terminal domain-containing protein, partial [Gemmatimonadaceae bacterium]